MTRGKRLRARETEGVLSWCRRLAALWPLRDMADDPPTWWVAGGVALALHFNRALRSYGDVDIAVRTTSTTAGLADTPEDAAPWAAELAARLRDLPNGARLCLLPSSTGPALDVFVFCAAGDAWRPAERQHPSVPWDQAILRFEDSVPYLAPELVLLLKSRAPRARDHEDAEHAMAALDPVRRARLLGWLPREHPWLERAHDDRSD